MKYTNRNTTSKVQLTYEIHNDEIRVYEAFYQLRDHFKFHDIESIYLIFTPTRVLPKNHQCSIKTESGKTFKIRSYNYISVGNFEDKSNAYEDFINALLNKTKNYPIRFYKGLKKVSYIIFFFFTIAGGGFMSFLAYAIYDRKNDLANAIIAAIAALLIWIIAIKISVIFKPQKLDPNEVFKIQ